MKIFISKQLFYILLPQCYIIKVSYLLVQTSFFPSYCSKDFVMYVGGSVWALDWCPRFHDRPASCVKCEVFL